MKTTISIILFFALSFVSKGQGNLQFNAVKYIKFDKTFTVPNSLPVYVFDSTVTVPVGKVWKIESSRVLQTPSTGGSSSTLDEMYICIGPNSTPSDAANNFPIWLPPGSYKLGLRVTSGTLPTRGVCFFSIIEFNLVQ